MLDYDIGDEIFRLWNLIIPVWSCVFKRDLGLPHLCQDDRIVLGQDFAFMLEYLLNANKIYFFDKSLYTYNLTNPEGLMNNNYWDFNNAYIFLDYLCGRLYGINPRVDRQLQLSIPYHIYTFLKNIASNRNGNITNKYTIRNIKDIFKANKHLKKKTTVDLNELYMKYFKNAKALPFKEGLLWFFIKRKLYRPILFYCYLSSKIQKFLKK